MIENSAEEIEYFYEEHAEQVNVIKVSIRKNVSFTSDLTTTV